MACFWRSREVLAAVRLAILRSSARECFSWSSFARGRTYRFSGRVGPGDSWGIVGSAVVGTESVGWSTVWGIRVECSSGGHIVPGMPVIAAVMEVLTSSMLLLLLLSILRLSHHIVCTRELFPERKRDNIANLKKWPQQVYIIMLVVADTLHAGSGCDGRLVSVSLLTCHFGLRNRKFPNPGFRLYPACGK